MTTLLATLLYFLFLFFYLNIRLIAADRGELAILGLDGEISGTPVEG